VKNDQDIQLQRSFGLRVKELRDRQGMTQEDLADAANLFRTYLSRIETGVANPSLTVIHSLALALSKSPGELLQPPALDYQPTKTRATAPISRGRVNR
jgi:transcriptional regulator with XRE-family HTH domain